MRNLAAIVLILSAAIACAASHSWQQAKLVSIDISDGPIIVSPITGGGLIGGRLKQKNYNFEMDGIRFTVSTLARKPLNLTVNKGYSVSLEGQKAFIVDDSGKTLKLPVAYKEQH